MIKEINIKDRKAAKQVLSVQLPAYKIEAEIIGYPDLPPLKDSADALRITGETFFGYFIGEKLCGVISFKEKNDVLDIHRLIVHPEHFRKGIAQKLLNFIELRPMIEKMVVTTGSKNTPAVAFYVKNGFKEVEKIKINDSLTITAFEKLLWKAVKVERNGNRNFKLREAIEILERTPDTLDALLRGLSSEWLNGNEGEGTWNAAEVVDHLIDGEEKNWIPRLTFILQKGESKPFPPIDRFAHLSLSGDLPFEKKLEIFKTLRMKNLATLRSMPDLENHFEKKGLHPAFGPIRVRELISTWTVHDLTHISQISRVLANRYKTDVGPWIEYLSILKK